MNRTWFGAKFRKPRESKLLALLPPMLRPEPPLPACSAGPEGELGWTVGLCRGNDLPPLRLSIRAQPDARLALRFDPIDFDFRAELPEDRC